VREGDWSPSLPIIFSPCHFPFLIYHSDPVVLLGGYYFHSFVARQEIAAFFGDKEMENGFY